MDYKPDINLKTTFDGVAKKYEEARLGYPDELFEKLIEVTGIDTEKSNLLEIGCGTGKATVSLAKKGFKILGVEPGEQLAELARNILAPYPDVTIQTTTFEQVSQPPNSIDLIFAANAFHWVDPAVKFKKTHDLLKPHSYLAIISNERVADEKNDEYNRLSQVIFEKYIPGADIHKPVKKISEMIPSDEYDHDLFELAYYGCFPVSLKGTTDQAIKLLETVSHTIALDEETRNKFFGEMRELIDGKFGGIVEGINGNILTVLRAK
uniref:Methyltransferase type 11 domain-containing protein n=1 Tax=Acrobeloides nanus TaxID=290746 RepID=A0A914DD68_9BILA